MNKPAGLVLVLALAAGCSAPEADFLPPPEPGKGVQIAMDTEAGPGEEIWRCKIFTFQAEGLQQINHVIHKQTSVVHHMDIMAILTTKLNRPDGVYDCKQLYDELPSLMEETTIYASQLQEDEIKLPPGIVAPVPGGLTMLYEMHLVNASDQPQKVSSRVNAYTIPDEEVKGTIFGDVTRDRHINVPPMAPAHVEWSRCTFDTDIDVIMLASHTHELGRDFRIKSFDGNTVGPELFRNLDWETPQIARLATPLHIAKGQGFEFSCQFASDRPTLTRWGFGAKDEMCQMVYVYTPGNVSAHCKVVETSDGVIME
jgi:hypothetical protein